MRHWLLRLSQWTMMCLALIVVCPAPGLGQTSTWEQLMAAAVTAMDAGRLGEAENLFLKSVTEAERFLPDDPRLPQSLTALATLYDGQTRFDEAETLLKRALTLRERALGRGHADVAITLAALARHYRDRGRLSEAAALYRQALTMLEKTLGPEHPETGITRTGLGALYVAQGWYPEAEEMWRRRGGPTTAPWPPPSIISAICIDCGAGIPTPSGR